MKGAWEKDIQTGGNDPAKLFISGRVRGGGETVPGWVVSIKVSKGKSVRGV